jgi:uncharacterized protein YcfL
MSDSSIVASRMNNAMDFHKRGSSQKKKVQRCTESIEYAVYWYEKGKLIRVKAF